jgi:hypothetical protein
VSVILGLKLALVPLLIGAVTLAGRRWGPAMAGWLSGFPIVAGPILFFIAVEQGATFVARAAVGTLSAVLAILAFGVSYAWAATRFGWIVSLMAGFSAYLLAVACLSLASSSAWWVAPFVIGALLIAPQLFPRPDPARPIASSRGNDIYLRMIAGAILVFLVTRFSSALGPQLSGVFAMFPVMASVLVAFSHRHSGAEFAVNLLRGMVLGFYSFATFCFVLALMLPAVDIGPAFAAALGCAALVQTGSRIYLGRKATPPLDPVVQGRPDSRV